jgi:hypothetical protein
MLQCILNEQGLEYGLVSSVPWYSLLMDCHEHSNEPFGSIIDNSRFSWLAEELLFKLVSNQKKFFYGSEEVFFLLQNLRPSSFACPTSLSVPNYIFFFLNSITIFICLSVIRLFQFYTCNLRTLIGQTLMACQSLYLDISLLPVWRPREAVLTEFSAASRPLTRWQNFEMLAAFILSILQGNIKQKHGPCF